MSDVTRILNAMERGDAKATDELLPLVYDELRLLAAQKLSREVPGQTLQATALVHEVYLRLVGDGPRLGTAEGTSSPPPQRRCGGSSSRMHVARRVTSTEAGRGGSNSMDWRRPARPVRTRKA